LGRGSLRPADRIAGLLSLISTTTVQIVDQKLLTADQIAVTLNMVADYEGRRQTKTKATRRLMKEDSSASARCNVKRLQASSRRLLATCCSRL
jgi:hypothetical protein